MKNPASAILTAILISLSFLGSAFMMQTGGANLKKASRDHVSNHKSEGLTLLVKSLACKFTGFIFIMLRYRSTFFDIISETS